MKTISRIFFFVAVAVLFVLTACESIHEFPEKGKEVDPTIVNVDLKIKCKFDLEGYHVVTKAADPVDPSKETEAKYDRRFFVDIRSNEYVDTLVEHRVITRPVSDTSVLIVSTTLKSRKYKLVVWMDYVLKGTESDLYYNTSSGKDLSAIHVPDKSVYVAGTDYKDAQHFLTELDLTPYVGVWYTDITLEAPMQRPMAKITFLAEDLDKYAKEMGITTPLDQLADNMKVEFFYNGYLPTGFNATTGRLNDAETGYTFNHKAIYPTDFEGKTYTLVGSDIIFVNGESSSVTLSAVVTDKSGKLVNQVSSITVPVYKNKETVVICKFFTRDYVPGIGIDPGFDGEFNIYV